MKKLFKYLGISLASLLLITAIGPYFILCIKIGKVLSMPPKETTFPKCKKS